MGVMPEGTESKLRLSGYIAYHVDIGYALFNALVICHHHHHQKEKQQVKVLTFNIFQVI